MNVLRWVMLSISTDSISGLDTSVVVDLVWFPIDEIVGSILMTESAILVWDWW